MLAASHARAGSYSGPVYSDGEFTLTLTGGRVLLDISYSGTGPYGFSGGVPGTAQASGTITTTFTWVPASGQTATTDPPPASIVVQEDCTATASSATGTSGTSLLSPSADCDNGLNGPVTKTPSVGPGVTIIDAQCSSTRYKVISGSSTISLSCSPSAKGVGCRGGGAYVGYTAAVYPVTISLGGATPDGSGGYAILVGQHCMASLSGIPSNCTVSNYSWSVSGPTYQTWLPQTPAVGNNPYNSDASYEVDGPGTLTNPTAQWCWNEIGNGGSKSETVTCTATVTPPAGQGTAFPVTVTQQINVWSPIWTCTGTGGEVDVKNNYLQAIPTASDLQNNLVRGMTWQAPVSPPIAPVSFGAGSLLMGQIVTSIDFSYLTNTFIPSIQTSPLNGETGLDTAWPYPWVAGSPYYISGDSPGFDVTKAQSANMNISFEDYLMYLPPGSGRYVPLAHYIWTASGSATIPSTNNWINFTGNPAGTVTDSNKSGTFVRSNEFPMWTQILTAPTSF